MKRLAYNEKPGPNFGEGGFQTEMLIDLSAIRYQVDEFKKKKGVQQKISQEDQFMMAGVQPATHSRHITNEYFLKIELEYDGCTCCANLPDTCMPFTIVPIVNPACFGFQPPNGWLPIELGFFKLDFSFI